MILPRQWTGPHVFYRGSEVSNAPTPKRRPCSAGQKVRLSDDAIRDSVRRRTWKQQHRGWWMRRQWIATEGERMCGANFTRCWLTHDRVMRCGMTLLVVTITFALAACSGSTSASTATTATAAQPQAGTALPPAPRRLASDPVQLADDLVADEQALRDPTSSEALLTGAAHRQQAAYRALGCPPRLLDIYDRNADAHGHFFGPAASLPQDTLPAWRINPPVPANEL